MIKKYNIKVNGVQYEVEVEAVDEKPIPQADFTGYQAAAKPSVQIADGIRINAPMQGTVLKVNVSSGSEVKAGQSLVVLESMKMENEISAPEDGIIASVEVSAGMNVSAGSTLIIYRKK